MNGHPFLIHLVCLSATVVDVPRVRVTMHISKEILGI